MSFGWVVLRFWMINFGPSPSNWAVPCGVFVCLQRLWKVRFDGLLKYMEGGICCRVFCLLTRVVSAGSQTNRYVLWSSRFVKLILDLMM